MNSDKFLSDVKLDVPKDNEPPHGILKELLVLLLNRSTLTELRWQRNVNQSS